VIIDIDRINAHDAWATVSADPTRTAGSADAEFGGGGVYIGGGLTVAGRAPA
jgi:hypothetical protein